MKVQRLIEKYKKLEGVWDAPGAETARQIFLQDLEQLDEPQKPVVPQFVADWIETAKKATYNIRGAIEMAPNGRVKDWLELKNVNIFAEAWVNGYEVEKEKRYEVILCNGQSLKTVYRQGEDRLDFEKEYGELERFTRKQLEEAGFGWVFDCPGVEVEEVTE
jgi:hypothetical protein|nr:MAG TPA: Protein of unknown function (DUF1642) [Caudoviricetes sp.]